MMAINLGIEFELRPQLRNKLRIGIENGNSHSVPRPIAGGVGKLAFIHLLHLLDLRPSFSNSIPSRSTPSFTVVVFPWV